jgi:competence protein ComEA
VAREAPPPQAPAGAPGSLPPGLRARARQYLEELADVTGTTGRLLVVGCLAVGVVAGVVWWLTRQAPVPVESTLPMVEPASVTTTTSAPAPVLVHVAGAVAAPGVQQLPAEARVIDAVEAAGGLTPSADPGRVNLAAEVVDGSQVYVPEVGEDLPTAPAAAPPGAPTGPTATVDVNAADGATLETLPGIGPATAAAIIEHRERNGPFPTVEALLEVRGIGEAKLAELRDLVRV